MARQPDAVIERLDVDIRRAFTDVIRTSAPWLRQFPTVRDLDNELGAFLLRPQLLDAASEIVPIAEREQLVPTLDAEILKALKEAAERGDVQGQKARTHTVHSVTNLVVRGAAILATVYLGAVGSKLADHSIVANKVARVLLTAEKHVAELLSDVPDDLRIALKSLMENLKNSSEGSWF